MSREPEIVATLERKPWIVLLPDGRLAALYVREVDGFQEVPVRYSEDGLTWGKEVTLLKLPEEPGGWAGPVALVDHEGELHLFLLNDAGEVSGKSVPIRW